MKNKILLLASSLCLSLFFLGHLQAQCETWVGKDREDEAVSAHSIYREAIKAKDYKLAFPNWKTAYEIAPAADGKRDYHYTDGVKLYIQKFKNATSEEEKKEAKKMVNMLYDQAIDCYKNKAIKISKCKDPNTCYDHKMGYLSGRKAYDLFYTFNASRKVIFDAVQNAANWAGNKAEYIILDPGAASIVHLYENEKITADEARSLHQKLIEIADYNIENNKTYGQYYDQSKKSMNIKMAAIEDDLYDCQYFMDRYLPKLKENPQNDTLMEKVYKKLLQKKCDTTLPEMVSLKKRYETYVEEYNAKVRAELAAKNPAYAAKLLYDEGDFEGAVKKYSEAIENETDNEKRADYHFRKASILGRKLKQYSAARSEARKAAELKENWGRPYMLIGDLYASSSCGDNWNKRLAILAAIDKYAYAKSIDPEVASEANSRIATYSSSKPLQQEGFMRGYKAGQSVKVNCWIGESVRLRFTKG